MSTYEHAILEYEHEDDDGKYKLIYTYFGLAIYFSQCLEETFSIMLYTKRICNKDIKTNKEINEIIDFYENSKKTMGNFINEVKQNYNLSNDIIKNLEKTLEKRNYLAHKYFKLEIQKVYSEIGRKEMLHYFSTFIDETKKIDDELKSYYEIYLKKMNITDEFLEKVLIQMRKEEMLKDNKN